MRQVLELPRLLGTRQAAADVVERANLPEPLDGDVVVLANSVAAVSPSYADELVKQLLEVHRAEEILIVGGSPHLQDRLKDAAQRRSMGDKVRTVSPSEAGV